MELRPVSYLEIQAFSAVMGLEITPFEADCIRACDETVLASLKDAEPDKPPPLQRPKDDAPALFASIKRMAGRDVSESEKHG